VLDEVTLGVLIISFLVNLLGFVILFNGLRGLYEALSTASQNFQASNESIAQAIVSLGSLLDDLDEVSGELVRPPQISDVLAQGLQMFMFSKLQGMIPNQMMGGIEEMINNKQSNPDTWQKANVQNHEGHQEVQDG